MNKILLVLVVILLQFSIANYQTNPKGFLVLQGLYFGQEIIVQKPELFAENILPVC
jgi:hypothetical protein